MRSKGRRKKNKYQLGVLIMVMVFCLLSIYTEEIQKSFGLIQDDDIQNFDVSELRVFYLDVGQADAILVQNDGENMLIDAGNNKDGPLLVDYFKELGIDHFKYVVGTHPHEDHIGGLDDVIDNFSIDTIYLPDVITTTATFMDVLSSIKNKNMAFSVPRIDDEFLLGNVKFRIIYTGSDADDLNDCSIVLKANFLNTSFLFTGDATNDVEKNILNKDIRANVLKVAHHGSKYSSSKEFLEKVNPKYAVISVGEHNSYGHPGNETIEKLVSRNIDILRTDQEGTILFTSDGNSISHKSFRTNTNG